MIWWLWHFVKTFYLKISNLNTVQAYWNDILQYNTIWHNMIWYEEVYNIYHKNIYYKLGLGLYCTYYIICITYNIQSSSWKYAHISDFWDVSDSTLWRWYHIYDENEMASRHGILTLAETQKIISHLIPFYRTYVFHFGRTAVFKHNSSTFNPLNFQGTYQSMLWIINLKTKI